jgi:NAD(P)-dependent dehydrogenase (short-subunit alcohol dehydrogenase family)
MTTLHGKTLFITGASRGIGLAIALRAARDGAQIVVAAKTAESNPKLPGTIHSAAAEIEAAGGQALAIQCDIRDEASVQAAVAAATARFGGIDILVNNAATSPHFGPILEAEESQWDKTLEVNVKGYVHTVRACVPRMRERGGGRIVNIASVAGMFPHRGLGVYCVSKAAVLMLTRALGMELAKENIRVNAIAPGIIRTKFSEVLWSSPDALSTIPQGRIGEPEDIVGAVLYFAGQASGFTTGSVLVIDGGQTLGLAY